MDCSPIFALVSPTSLRIMAHDCGTVYVLLTPSDRLMTSTLYSWSLVYSWGAQVAINWRCIMLTPHTHHHQSMPIVISHVMHLWLHTIARSFAIEHAYDDSAAHDTAYAPVA